MVSTRTMLASDVAQLLEVRTARISAAVGTSIPGGNLNPEFEEVSLWEPADGFCGCGCGCGCGA